MLFCWVSFHCLSLCWILNSLCILFGANTLNVILPSVILLIVINYAACHSGEYLWNECYSPKSHSTVILTCVLLLRIIQLSVILLSFCFVLFCCVSFNWGSFYCHSVLFFCVSFSWASFACHSALCYFSVCHLSEHHLPVILLCVILLCGIQLSVILLSFCFVLFCFASFSWASFYLSFYCHSALCYFIVRHSFKCLKLYKPECSILLSVIRLSASLLNVVAPRPMLAIIRTLVVVQH